MLRLDNCRIRISSPSCCDLQGEIGDGVAACLSHAFSSGLWASSPMPLGEYGQRNTARGIIAELSDQAQAVVASVTDCNSSILGCVVGGLLNSPLIAAYGLSAFGAQSGDALLAYIGVMPEVQGSRVSTLPEETFEIGKSRAGERSLAGLLFERWLALPAVNSRPRIFVRTRREIGPILHFLEKYNFRYLGEFDLSFQGAKQTRLVFQRSEGDR